MIAVMAFVRKLLPGRLLPQGLAGFPIQCHHRELLRLRRRLAHAESTTSATPTSTATAGAAASPATTKLRPHGLAFLLAQLPILVRIETLHELLAIEATAGRTRTAAGRTTSLSSSTRLR